MTYLLSAIGVGSLLFIWFIVEAYRCANERDED